MHTVSLGRCGPPVSDARRMLLSLDSDPSMLTCYVAHAASIHRFTQQAVRSRRVFPLVSDAHCDVGRFP